MDKHKAKSTFELPLDLLDALNGNDTPCKGAEEVGFYPFPSSYSEMVASKNFCQRCPIRTKCLSEGILLGETGMWGGFYLYNGKIMRGKSAFLGCKGVRTETEEEMFEEDYIPIPVEKLDAYNSGEWDPI